MKVLGKDKLTAFMQKNAMSRKPLTLWLADAERSIWQTPQDIKNAYRSADFLSDNRVIFRTPRRCWRRCAPSPRWTCW